MKYIILILKGICIGIANVIPGVSGGTMAFILGIYEKLTEAIGNFFLKNKPKKEYFLFLFTLAIGVFIGIIFFAKLFGFILKTEIYTQFTYFFFIGLILGSIPYVMNIHKDMKINFSRLASFVIAVGLILLTTVLGIQSEVNELNSNNAVSNSLLSFDGISLGYGIWLFICGFLAAGSMVLPGFSGSALLIGLGEYSNILFFVNERMLVPIGIVILGVIPGILIFAKVINLFLNRFPSNTYYFILGLIIASVYQVFLEIRNIIDFGFVSIAISALMLLLGFILAFLLSKINIKK